VIANADDNRNPAGLAARIADLEQESLTRLQQSRLRVARHQERRGDVGVTRWAVAVLSEAAEELRQSDRRDELTDEAEAAAQDEYERRLLENEIEDVSAAGGDAAVDAFLWERQRQSFEEGWQSFEEGLRSLRPDYGREDRSQQQSAPLSDAELWELIDGIKARGITSYTGIAAELNRQAIQGPRGGKWYATSVRKFLERIRSEMGDKRTSA
jgi:hypothetical protein